MIMRSRVGRRSLLVGAGAMALGAPFAGRAWAQDSAVTFTSWGGAFQDALRANMLAPAAKTLGITVREDTTNGIQDVRAQITARKVTWDVTEQELPTAETLKRENALEPLDYAVISTDGIPQELVNSHYVGFINFTKVIAWQVSTYGENGPKTWADFWDVKKFPGKRSLFQQVNYALEAATMAQGVPIGEVYKVLATKDGMDRGWAKLEEIAPHITVWYRGGSQSAQLLRDGEVDIIHMGHNRVESVIGSGKKVAYQFDGGTMDIDALMVPRGAPNKANAMRLINELLKPDAQARLAKAMPLGPVNTKAFATGILTDAEALKVNTHASNIGKQLLVDPNFYVGRLDQLTERFERIKQKRG
ncbi:MAG: ABC transporter substrate-binding protein [Gammaproteobacteria bacterium]|nr:ABC transporter substrate-binding protein [Gammaproteobacteria bacterium]